MSLVLIVIIILIVFGTGFGVTRTDGNYRNGIGIGGIILLILLAWLLFGGHL